MLSFADCFKIAKSKKKYINHCVEYSNAYMFSFEGVDNPSGVDSPIVVLKDSGDIMNMSAYIWTPDKEYVGVVNLDGSV